MLAGARIFLNKLSDRLELAAPLAIYTAPPPPPPTRPTQDAGLGGAAAQHCRLGSLPEDLIHDPVASVLYI